MKIKKVIRLANLYYALTASSDTSNILKKISKLDTFKDRTELAEKEFKHLSSGSSRVIYKIDDNIALKLAKNDRGIAQNKAEANPKIKSKYINKTIEADADGVWNLAPLCEKITEKEFEKMIGISFKDFGAAISYGLRKVANNSDEKKPDNFDKVSKTDIYKELVENGKEFDLMPGDLERISSFGQKDGHPLVLDIGLNRKIWEQFYNSK